MFGETTSAKIKILRKQRGREFWKKKKKKEEEEEELIENNSWVFSFKERGKTWIKNLMIFVVEGNLYWKYFFVRKMFEQKEFWGKNYFQKKKVSMAFSSKEKRFGSQKSHGF